MLRKRKCWLHDILLSTTLLIIQPVSADHEWVIWVSHIASKIVQFFRVRHFLGDDDPEGFGVCAAVNGGVYTAPIVSSGCSWNELLLLLLKTDV